MTAGGCSRAADWVRIDTKLEFFLSDPTVLAEVTAVDDDVATAGRARAAADLAAAAVQDEARLAAVRGTGLLDSAAEPAFDRLTRLAVRLLGAPAAFFSMVDATRDFYKSACGLPEPLATSR